MRKPLKRGGIRTYLLILSMVAAVFAATPMSIGIGAALLVLGMVGNIWAKGCLHRNQEVSRTGPYRFVRHPFYTANAVLDAGIVVMSGSWVLMVLAPIWWVLVYLPVMREEEEHLTGLFGDAYRDYAAVVPRLIPWRKPLPAGPSGFSWANRNIVSQEVGRALRHLSYPFVFLLILRLRQRGWAVVTDPAVVDVLIIACLVGLWLGLVIWRTHRRKVSKRGRIAPVKTVASAP